jgi:hypothetical protein
MTGGCGESRQPGLSTASMPPDRAENYQALEEKIRSGMAAHAIPGVAVGVWGRGMEYIQPTSPTSPLNTRQVDVVALCPSGHRLPAW